MKLKRGQKYVVVCHKRVKREDVLLGSGGSFNAGCYVSFDGAPTKNIDEAYVYTHKVLGEEFPWEDDVGGVYLDTYFRSVPVKLTVKRTK